MMSGIGLDNLGNVSKLQARAESNQGFRKKDDSSRCFWGQCCGVAATKAGARSAKALCSYPNSYLEECAIMRPRCHLNVNEDGRSKVRMPGRR